MAAARYFDLIREMRDAYNHRLRLVESVRQRGIKPTARLFTTTVPTVRKWFRRYQQHEPSGLLEQSRASHHQPRKTIPEIEQEFVALRQQLPTFGARSLIREHDLPISRRALERIWRVHGLLKKRRRKYQRKQDLAHIKAQWALFQQISADTKDLDDIPVGLQLCQGAREANFASELGICQNPGVSELLGGVLLLVGE
jgi:transposase